MDNIWMINMDFTMIILNDVDIDDDRWCFPILSLYYHHYYRDCDVAIVGDDDGLLSVLLLLVSLLSALLLLVSLLSALLLVWDDNYNEDEDEDDQEDEMRFPQETFLQKAPMLRTPLWQQPSTGGCSLSKEFVEASSHCIHFVPICDGSASAYAGCACPQIGKTHYFHNHIFATTCRFVWKCSQSPRVVRFFELCCNMTGCSNFCSQLWILVPDIFYIYTTNVRSNLFWTHFFGSGDHWWHRNARSKRSYLPGRA